MAEKLNRYKMNLHPCDGLFFSMLELNNIWFLSLDVEGFCAEAGLLSSNGWGLCDGFRLLPENVVSNLVRRSNFRNRKKIISINKRLCGTDETPTIRA